MRLFAFQSRYGHDKTCRTEQKGLKEGDLLVGKNDMFLVLGETLKRGNDEKKNMITEELEVHHKKFLSGQTISLIHRMVHQYYTSYKNVVKLFVTGELSDLFTREISVKKKAEQSLYVYPDARTMENLPKPAGLDPKTTAVLTGTSTQVQQDKIRRGIKMGHIHTLLCTYSQIFQDRKDLKRITIYDSHQRYYKNQQDPRYDTREVLRQLAKIHNVELRDEGVHIFTGQ